MEGIFQAPYGCFEQTSSTTYPNVLALEYLRRTNKSARQVEETANRYINLGYQRLLSFEIAGGGFDWFGHPPANRTLSAYGLMEFKDMARVHDIDPKLISALRHMAARPAAGRRFFGTEQHQLHEDPTRVGNDLDRLSTTAYIAWAVFANDASDSIGDRRAVGYMLGREPAAIDDSYVLALVANALQALDRNPRTAAPYVNRLDDQCKRSPDAKLAWWELPQGRRTTFYGDGNCGSVETTSLATLAIIRGNAHPETAHAALTWLVAQKDQRGTWGSTQATVMALKALLAGTGQPFDDGQPRHIDFSIDGKQVRSIDIAPDQGDVMQLIDLTSLLTTGDHRLGINERSDAACAYEASLVYNESGANNHRPAEPLTLSLNYDKTKLTVDDQIEATASVTNRREIAATMVIVDLPIPAGFALETADLDSLRTAGRIAKYQTTPSRVVIYLRELRVNEPLILKDPLAPQPCRSR